MLALHIISAIALIVWAVGGGIYLAKRRSKPQDNPNYTMTKYQDKY